MELMILNFLRGNLPKGRVYGRNSKDDSTKALPAFSWSTLRALSPKILSPWPLFSVYCYSLILQPQLSFSASATEFITLVLHTAEVTSLLVETLRFFLRVYVGHQSVSYR